MPHIPPMPPAASLDDLRSAAPGVTADDLVHVATVAALHLRAAGWTDGPDGWIDPRRGDAVAFPVAVDRHLRTVAVRGGGSR